MNSVIKLLPYDQIIKQYKSGTSIISLSKTYKCSQGTIARLLKGYNIDLRSIQESVGGVYISNTEIQRIKQLYLSGSSKQNICQLYKCSINTLKSFLKKNNIKKRNTKSWRPILDMLKKNKDDIIKLYNEHNSITPIMKYYSCDFGVVAKFMDEERIKRKNNIFNPIPKMDTKKLYKLHHQEMYTMDQIANLYNCSAPTVADFFDKNNIPRRPASETSRITAQSTDTILKQKKSLFTHKGYKLPSSRIIKLQGYEPQFLDYCILNSKILKEQDFDFDTTYKFKYVSSDNKAHYYYPDFYIKKHNLIIEVKSSYILKKQTEQVQSLKQQAVLSAGYKYLFILDNDFEPLHSFLKEQHI